MRGSHLAEGGIRVSWYDHGSYQLLGPPAAGSPLKGGGAEGGLVVIPLPGHDLGTAYV